MGDAALDSGETSRVAFQESDDFITMTRRGEWVRLDATYVDGSGSALLTELRGSFGRFAKEQINALRTSYPRVSLNPSMSRLLRVLSFPDDSTRWGVP
jgi:hypothetical protein